jgi:hypothetical protein
MTRKWLAIAGLISIFTLASAFAEVEKAISIESNALPDTCELKVLRNDNSGAVEGLALHCDGKPDSIFTIQDIKTGVRPLFQMGDRKVVLLSLERDFNPAIGGHVKVRYLHNGATGDYKNFRILVSVEKDIIFRSDPSASDPDSDDNPYTSVFNHLYLQKKSIFGKTIGIEKVLPSIN